MTAHKTSFLNVTSREKVISSDHIKKSALINIPFQNVSLVKYLNLFKHVEKSDIGAEKKKKKALDCIIIKF